MGRASGKETDITMLKYTVGVRWRNKLRRQGLEAVFAGGGGIGLEYRSCRHWLAKERSGSEYRKIDLIFTVLSL